MGSLYRSFYSLTNMLSPIFESAFMDLITNCGGESNFNRQLGAKMNHITTVKSQLCYPCNKNLSLLKRKQVLNSKVHNLRKTASRFLFW